MKYSLPDSPIEIQVGFVNGAASVEITDHGEGIPASEQTRIVQRFYRSPSVQHQVQGSGLGLCIAHRIGRILVIDDEPQIGESCELR